MLMPRAFLVGVVLALLAMVLALVPTPPSHASDDKTPDSTTPLAADIKRLEEVELTLDDQKLTTTLLYSRRGTTLFAFPPGSSSAAMQTA
jgi:hypothetical protein